MFKLVTGGTLKDHLISSFSTHGFHVKSVQLYAAELLLAIEYLHLHDYLYRDIKPDHILLDHLGHIQLIGLDSARKVDKNKFNRNFAGTMYYIAPEVYSQRCIFQASDLWSYAVCLYELATGHLPSCTCDLYTRPSNGINTWCTFSNDIQHIEKAINYKQFNYNSHIIYPKHMDIYLQDLLSKLLIEQPNQRLTIVQIKS